MEVIQNLLTALESPPDDAEQGLMDEFIKSHAQKYNLLFINYDAPFEQSTKPGDLKMNSKYIKLMQQLIDVRLDKSLAYNHQLRVHQCLRILARDEELCNEILYSETAETDEEIVRASKESRLDKLINSVVELSQVCIQGQNHHMNNTAYMNKTGKLSPGRLT